jgi:hypothetical protein
MATPNASVLRISGGLKDLLTSSSIYFSLFIVSIIFPTANA